MKYVLFVCTHNAGRSQMAQAFFEHYGPADVRSESAGQEPRREGIWPNVIEAMREIGIELADRRPRKRLEGPLPRLIDEFEGRRSAAEIRACADAVLTCFDDAPVRSFVATLAERQARECLRAEHSDALATA
ncbi:MAG TPA: hypothetical protein VGV40_12440 [Solirubrobacteraceae bacterium]|nr:hypothetical protein [Solirubrobacteraceae bacterium]